MGLVDRVKNILMSPRTEWPVIAAEPATVGSLYTGYIMILAAIAPVATTVWLLLSGNLVFAIGGVLVSYLISLGATYVIALIVDALAPMFGGEKNFLASLKLIAYSYTAAWVAGIFSLLGPLIGGPIALIASLYSCYLLYVGAPIMKKVPAEKAVAFTLVVIVCAIVLFALLAGILTSLRFGGAMMGGYGSPY